LEWVDNSNDETGFQFEITVGDGAPFLQNGPAMDATTFTFSGFTPGSPVTFRLRAVKPLEGGGAGELDVSEWTAPVEVVTENLNFLTSAVTGTPGSDFTYTVLKDFECDSIATTGMVPAWLSFDTDTFEFTAVNPPTGSVRVNFEGTKGIHTREGFLHLNIINEGPTVLQSPTPLSLLDEAPMEIELGVIFEDPDFIRAASVDTDFGAIILGFYDGFPITVGNFFAYAESDAWDGAFFHRMAKLQNGENFVLQGGGFRPDTDPGTYTRVTQLPAIMNEFDPSRPNLAGTISMAKLSGDPDSATNQFFISLNDNRSILDPQNGGFTVFGRAADISAADKIAVLDRGTFNVPLDDSLVTLGDWPLKEIDDDSPSFDQLVSMNDVFEIPTLTYSFSSDGDEVVVAEVAPTLGAPLVITRTGMAGSTELTITARDLDGAEVSTTLPITVTINYDVWAARESASGPGESSDAGQLTNFEEYAYGGDPNDASDDLMLLPKGGTDDGGYGTVTFHHRDFADDLSYRVESTTDFLTWDTVWESGDGFEDGNISSVTDEGELKLVSVRSDELIAGMPTLFFRLVISAQE